MKHSKLRLFIGVLLIAASLFSMAMTVSADSGAPAHYIAFDSEYYHDAIGNAYGFTNTAYIDVEDEKISGAVRLTFEKSPYEYNGTYDESGFTGVFDPYLYLPLYEIEEDINCEDIGAVVLCVRVQNDGGNDLKVNDETPIMYFATDKHPIITGKGDYLSASTSYEKDSGEWTTIVFDLSKKVRAWNGVLQCLRFDPFSAANDDMDYLDIAGFALFENSDDAKAFDGDFKSLKADSGEDTAKSSFGLGTAAACVIAAFGINADLLKKKRVRAIVALCLIVMLALSVVGCGKDTKTEGGNTPTTSDSLTGTDGNTDTAGGTTTVTEETLKSSGTEGDYKYELYETYAKITRYTGIELDVTVPDTIEGLPVKVIGYKAFFRNYNLDDSIEVGIEKLTLPDSVEIIEDYAFAGLEEVVEINFGKNLYSIGSNSIENCYALKTLNFSGNNLTKIGSLAFSACRVIEEVTLPDGVVEIGNAAFQYCHSLTEDKLSIPESAATIGKNIMFACTPLE